MIERADLTIGLSLSGGGFRAAFYGAGVCRYLAEAGLFESVVAISAVSGGALFAAMIADRGDSLVEQGSNLPAFLECVDSPFRMKVTHENLRNRWLAASVLSRLRGSRDGRGAVLGSVLGKELYRARHLRDLSPRGPQVVLATTDLSTGRAFRFSRDFVGSYDFGYVEPGADSLTVGIAAAASAAVPMLFPPVAVSTEGLGLRNAPPVLSLVDGGVYDNLGLEWFQGWQSGRPRSAVASNFLIVANATGPLNVTSARYGAVRGAWRAKDVQYAQTTRVRTRWLVDGLLRERNGAYVGIIGDPRKFQLADGTAIDPALYDGALPSTLVPPLAALRTDLDRFSRLEADLLSFHGYWSIHARLGSIYPELALSRPSWREYSNLSSEQVGDVEAVLRAGAKRLRRPIRELEVGVG